MRKPFGVLPILWLASLTLSATQLLGPPVIGNGTESGRVAATGSDGVERWTSRWTMREGLIEGQQVVVMTEEGEGRYSDFASEVRWHTETVWSPGDVFRPLRSDKVFSDPGGAPLLREHTEFDHGSRIVRFEREDLRTGETATETFDMPEDTLSIEGIAGALRSMPFEEGRPVRAHLFTPEPKLYEVTFEVKGRDTLSTPAGSIECYKVEVVPHLGILGVFRFFVPRTYFWFAVGAPHAWYRFEGLENGIGTPKIAMERVD